MAMYEFECADCGEQFSVELAMQSRADAKILCPACGSARAEQVYRTVQINTKKARCDHGAAGGCGCGCGGCCGDC